MPSAKTPSSLLIKMRSEVATIEFPGLVLTTVAGIA
jgi:hypothetical protein